MRGRVVAGVIALVLVLVCAQALAAGPPPPPGTGPKLKDPQPEGPGDAPGPAEGEVQSGIPAWSDVYAFGLSVEAFQVIDGPDDFYPGVFGRLDLGVIGILTGVLVSGPTIRELDSFESVSGEVYGDDTLFYFGFDLLNTLGVDIVDLGSTVIALLTPRVGMGAVVGEDTALFDFPVGLTGVRVTTCTPLCLRGDFRIPTFHVTLDPDDDFELLWASWGMTFEFTVLF